MDERRASFCTLGALIKSFEMNNLENLPAAGTVLAM